MDEFEAAESLLEQEQQQPVGSKRKADREDGAQGKRPKNRSAAASAEGAAAASASASNGTFTHGALDPAVAIAADAARDKLAARQASARSSATSAARAASGQLGGLNTDAMDVDGHAAAAAAEAATDAGAAASNEHALTDEDQQFYRFTEQHVSVKTRVEGNNGKSALSEVCYPPGWDMSKDASGIDWVRPPNFKPAKEYKFELDPFQRYAVDCLERNQSVLVSAHTSAGKTVVAEYAIAMALRDGARVIYTSPIKALSNQKYRELSEEFGDVGLMTGDVTINPSASCLVMTTEILRNMLYHGGEVMREAKFVIFDEVHYMRSKDRGVVWEEVMIMLPDAVRYVFLSATIPNGTEFALWIAKLHKQPCSVVYTDYRPTPLQHYLFPAGGDGLYLVMDDKGNFREDNFQKALAVLKADSSTGQPGGAGAAPEETGGASGKKGAGGSKKKKGGKPSGPSDIFKIVQTVKANDNIPVIVFSFSKRECESHALTMAQIDFNTPDEKACVDQVFQNAMAALSEADRHLPQVDNILPLLRRGVGIHHGGLLPILKEVVEILFQSELLKVLFSTETFSMGLNMPCKTVVFTSVKKWDGDVFRIVSGGEYIQMSGRAGRRGIDDRGIVIAMMDEQLEPTQAKEMIKGQSDPLNSSFHLGYNMLLNLLRSEDQTPAKMMARSFLQFQNTRKAPKLQGELEGLQAQRDAMSGQLKDAKAVKEFHELTEQLELYRQKISAFVIQPQFVERFLNPGRVLHIRAEKSGEPSWGWGVLVSYAKNTVAKESRGRIAAAGPIGTVVYVLQVLLKCAAGSGQLPVAAKKSKAKLPQNQKAQFVPAAADDQQAEWLVVPVLLQLVDVVSQVKSNIANRNMQDKATRNEMGTMLQTLVKSAEDQKKAVEAAAATPAAAPTASGKDKKKGKGDSKPAAAPAAAAPSGAPDVTRALDPVSDMKIAEPEFLDLQRKVTSLAERVATHKFSRPGVSDEVQEQLALYKQRTALDDQIVQLQLALKAASEDVNMKAQLRKMKSVLHRLGFTDAAGVVTAQKGGAACAISTSDELLVTQLMFEGVFAPLTPAQTVALCSALVFNEKSDDAPRLRDELAAPLRQLQEQARRVGQVQSEAGLALDVEEYVASFQSSLMDVVYAWCGGASFSDVCKLTDVFEGTIIRCLRRLEELLRQMAAAAKSIGDSAHEAKFSAGCALLKRDIVFAASLYL